MKQYKKSRLFLLPALIGVLSLGSTAAFMTAYAGKVNRIAVGHQSSVIEERFPDPGNVTIEENPHYTKTVWAANRSGGENGFSVDCYVRLSLSFSDSDIGKAVSLQGLNTEDWVRMEDGYYYYRKILKEGQATEPLFTGFSIRSEDVDPFCRNRISQFSISVYEESVQAGDFTSWQDAWKYYLTPISTV